MEPTATATENDPIELTLREKIDFAVIKDKLERAAPWREYMSMYNRIQKVLGTPHPDSSQDFQTAVFLTIFELEKLFSTYEIWESNLGSGKTKLADEPNHVIREIVRLFKNPLERAQHFKKEVIAVRTTDEERWDAITKGTSPRAIASSIVKNYRNLKGQYNPVATKWGTMEYGYRNVTGRGTR